MALGNPIDAWMQMAQMKNQNRQQMTQDIAGIGQGLGEGFNTIGQAVQDQKKRQVLQQLVQAMKQQGQPMQGPQLPGVGMTPGVRPPSSGMGAPSPDNSAQINSLAMQYDPKAMIQHLAEMQMNPLQKSEISHNNAMTAATAQKPEEIKAALTEKAREADANRQLRLLTAQTNALLAQGRINEARQSAEMRDQIQKSILQNKVDAFKGTHWFANMLPWKTATNQMKGPLDSVGWTPAQEARLKELEGKKK